MSGTSSHDVEYLDSDGPVTRGPTGRDDATLPAWDGQAYAANTAHHRAFDDGYLASTPIEPGQRLLDLGCGSGDLTATLAGLVGPSGHVVGVDAQPSMLAEAERRASPNQSFVRSALQDLATAFGPEHDATFDGVMSRATLHWIPSDQQLAVYAQMARLVRPGGFVRVECGGVGNITGPLRLMDEVSSRLGGATTPWTFADPATALDWLERAGLDVTTDAGCFVRCVGQRRAFGETTLVGWLESQVLNAYAPSLAADVYERFCAEIVSRVGELRRWDGTLDQTWVRLDLLARRPVGA